MLKSTPGPWKIGVNFTDERAIIGPSGQVVADASWTGGSGCELAIANEADARLIAAAPELLEALEMCLAYIETEDMRPLNLNKARAAIEKATGGDV